MENREAGGRVRRVPPWAWAAVTAVLGASLAYMLVLSLEGERLTRQVRLNGGVALAHSRHDILLPLIVALLSGALLGALPWLFHAAVRELTQAAERAAETLTRTRHELSDARAGLDATRAQVEDRRREAEQAHRDTDQARQETQRAREDTDQARQDARREGERRESELSARTDELERERQRRERVERAQQIDRRWNRELRQQVQRMHDQGGAFTDWNDIRAVVLRLATSLADAGKGLLLSREDHDSDERLVLVASEGFEADPADSQVAQRFAAEVIDRDRTVREDRRSHVQAEGATAADREIENLVAIPIYIRDRFSGVVICANKEGGFQEHDEEILLSIGDQAGAALENSRLHGEARGTYLATVRMLAEAIEVKDPTVAGHSDDVSQFVSAVAQRLELEPHRREALIFGSLLHDVGKLGISERILLKPDRLTPEERSVIELHPRIGYRLVQQVPTLNQIAPAILYHHERYDGDGYPSGLRGEQIPLEARIIAVTDAYSAMTSKRPYNSPRPPAEACAELERCAGSQFDPEVVRVFCQEVRRGIGERADDAGNAEAPVTDPELESRRRGSEPVFGYDAFEVTDNLTLLYSHRHLHEVAQAQSHRAAVQGRPFSVIVVELSELDQCNRRDGYAAGDAAIKEVARVIRHVAARAQATPCRLSGRRLAIVAETDAAGAAQIAAEITADLHAGPGARVSHATWQAGEEGDEVIARACAGPGAPRAAPALA